MPKIGSLIGGCMGKPSTEAYTPAPLPGYGSEADAFSKKTQASDPVATPSMPPLYRVIQKRRETINQPIVIETIHAQSLRPAGEFKAKIRKDRNVVTDIIQCLGSLCIIANTRHIERNFTSEAGQHKIKPDRANHITRLVTNEFAFYPSDGPLNNDQLLKILETLEILATTLQPNLVLILATFPVESRNGHYENVAMHVQCGPEPTIHLFAKTVSSSLDPLYPDWRPTDFFNPKIDGADPEVVSSKVTPPIITDEVDISFLPRDSAIEVGTLGGAKHLFCADICLDHDYGLAKANLRNYIARKRRETPLDPVPEQISQIVTSSSMDKVEKSQVDPHLMVADARDYFVTAPPVMRLTSHQRTNLTQVSESFGCKSKYHKTSRSIETRGRFGNGFRVRFHEGYSLSRVG